MGLTLAAMLGQIGLPGGGFGHGYGSMNEPGLPPLRFRLPSLPQGPNPVQTFIPVAAISDMLLHPGKTFTFNGLTLAYPDIKCVYWAGGNPFHHHQNLPRLRRALGRVDTVVVHDPYWTPMARHADIVVPSTTAFERDDFSGSRNDPLLMAMPALAAPYAQSRDDYTTFAELAGRLGFGERVHRRPQRPRVAGAHVREVVGGNRFRRSRLRPVLGRRHGTSTGGDRADTARRLPRRPADPSARHTQWADRDLLGDHRRVRLPGLRRTPAVVRPHRVAGRRAGRALSAASDRQSAGQQAAQPARRWRDQPGDESAWARTYSGASDGCRGQESGRRRRGAGVQRPRFMPGRRGGRRESAARVVQLSTGAWYDPLDPSDPDSMCVHGNPNVLTDDVGTSSLARGCTGAAVLVEIEKFTGALPPVRAHQPPVIR